MGIKSKKDIIIKILLFTSLIINYSITAEAKNQISFNNLTIESGLSQATVEVMLQDSKGYLWFGTNDGLNRYNGYDFKVYSYKVGEENSLINNYIIDIKEDNKENIWVATLGGISKISSDGEKITNYTAENSNLSSNTITNILFHSNGQVYIATTEGLNKYDKEIDDFVRVYEGELSSESVNSITEDNQGNIWLATDEGIDEIDVNNEEVVNYCNLMSVSDKSFYCVYYDKLGYIWAGTNNEGLVRINILNNEITTYKSDDNDEQSLPGNFVRSVLRDSNGTIWVATNSGLAKFDEEKERFITYTNSSYDNKSLADDQVFSIIEDQMGLLWVGTYSGISSFDPCSSIEHYKNDPTSSNTLSESMIKGLYEDEDGLIWIGTNSKGINILNRDNDEIRYINIDTVEASLSNNTINDITGYGDYIFVATQNGLNIINRKTFSIEYYYKKDGLRSSNVKRVYYDDAGYLWIGTADGINIFDLKNKEFIDTKEMNEKTEILNNHIGAIYKDSSGEYWVGTFTDCGLLRIDPKTRKIVTYKYDESSENCISSNTIRCVAEDSQGNIWIGTSSGLNKFDKNTGEFTVYTTEEGLSNNTVYGILIDDDDNIWVSTNNGLSKYDKEKEAFFNFNVSDGLQSNEFNGSAYHKLKSGELMFGGINGLNIFNPEDLSSSSNVTKVVFDEFEVNGVSYTNIDNLSFKYSENNFRIEFFLPNYKSKKNIQYYYTLNNDEWTLLTDNHINLINLSSGKYTFSVKARSNDGTISEVSTITFIIKAPFWRNRNSLFVYVMICIYLFFRNKIKVRRLDILVNKRTRELSDEMDKSNKLLNKVIDAERKKNNYFINLSHELRTPLNVIYSTEQLIRELNKKGISKEKLDYYMTILGKNTNRLLKIINDLIDTSKIENDSYQLNIKNNDIVYLVEETVLTLKDYVEKKGIELIVDPEMEEKVIRCDQQNIERCIINLVGNATKFTEAGGVITVRIKDMNDKVRIEVNDTGIGIDAKYHRAIFNRFNQVVDEHSETKGGSGLGLTITKQLVELHNGEIFVESEVGKGSTFVIILPV